MYEIGGHASSLAFVESAQYLPGLKVNTRMKQAGYSREHSMASGECAALHFVELLHFPSSIIRRMAGGRSLADAAPSTPVLFPSFRSSANHTLCLCRALQDGQLLAEDYRPTSERNGGFVSGSVRRRPTVAFYSLQF